MIIQKKLCDCCKKEMSDHWEETCNYIKLESSQSCKHPLKEVFNNADNTYQKVNVELKEVCSSCIRRINEGMAELFKKVIAND